MQFDIKNIGIISAPIFFILILISPLEIEYGAKIVLATTIWMIIWWITEAISIYVTAILPIILLPSFGVVPISEVVVSYSDKIIFLLLGGFILAAAIERTNLHERFALNMIRVFGYKPRRILAGLMITAGLLSAWINNTSTTLMMIPITASIIPYINHEERKRVGSIFMLSIAYASSIGGVATLIGTPPNAIFVSLAKSLLDRDIGFAEWMTVGMPLSLISLSITWLYMSRYIKSKMPLLDDIEIINKRLRELGPMSTNEKIVFSLFVGVVVAWITRSILWSKYIPMIDDSVIALLAAIILFAIPTKKRIIDWSISSSIPWGVLLLIGGGLTLASSFTITGLDKWFTSKLLFIIPSTILLIPIITTFTIFMGEIMSNTAMAALLIPIGASISTSFGVDAIVIMFIIALASSYSFMLPMSTPPNSIIFGSGYVTVREMTRIGFMINIFGIIVITLIGTFLIPIIVS